MIVIDQILISDEVLEERFKCNITKCKGACCKEGDFGAPLEKKELKIMDEILEDVLPYLAQEQVDRIKEKGAYTFFDELGQTGTQLMDDGRCAFSVKDQLGIYSCGIEMAHRDKKIDFKKPISCHLYPIRVAKNEKIGFEAMNYDRWDICSEACKLGDEEKISVFEFVKDAIIRKYGEDFYAHLEHVSAQKKKINSLHSFI